MCIQTCYPDKTDLLGNAWCQYCMGKKQMLIQHQPGILLAPHLPLGDDSNTSLQIPLMEAKILDHDQQKNSSSRYI